MIAKFIIWIKSISEGWKIFFGIVTAVGIIGTASIKINKGIEIMSDTAKTVKSMKYGYDSIRTDVSVIKESMETQEAIQSAQEESYVDHLKLENRLNEVIKYYERKAKAEDEKKN